MTTDPKTQLLSEPAQGVPSVIDDMAGYRRACRLLSQGSGALASDAERASGFRYGHDDYLVQFKRQGRGYSCWTHRL